MLRRTRYYLVVLSFIVLLISQFLIKPSSIAATTGTGINLTTSPVTLDLNIKPGTTSTQTLQVMNNSSQPVQINMKLKTFGAYGSSGQAALTDFLPNDPAKNYVTFSPSSFTAQPSVWENVKATISLPKSATLGYYYAVIFEPVTATPTINSPRSSIFKSSNAILMLIDTGSVNEQRQLRIASFSVNKKLFEYLPASFTVDIGNKGNIYLPPTGDIYISKNSIGTNTIDTIPINPGQGNVLPNSERVFSVNWSNGFPVFQETIKNGQPITDKKGRPIEKLNWNFSKANEFRFGKYYARLALEYNNGSHVVLLNSILSFWVIPWKLLLIVLVIVLLLLTALYFVFRGIIRRIRRLRTKKLPK